MTSANLAWVAKSFLRSISPGKDARLAQDVCYRYEVVSPGVGEPMAALSGGNSRRQSSRAGWRLSRVLHPRRANQGSGHRRA